MKKTIVLSLALMTLLAFPCMAQNYVSYQGDCERGGQLVVTSGLSSATKVQRSYPSCSVTVWIHGSSTKATLYSDDSGTSVSNPITADTTGHWQFYAALGRYDAQVSGGGITGSFTRYDLPSGSLFSTYYNVKSPPYKAKGDGVADDTSAIQAAITAAQNNPYVGGVGTVYIPSGVYNISSTLSVTAGYGISFVGLEGASILKWTGANNGTILYQHASSLVGVKRSFIGISFAQGVGITGVTGLVLGDVNQRLTNITVQRCQFQYLDVGAKVWNESDEVLWDDNWFTSTVTAGVLFASGMPYTGAGNGNHTFRDNHFQNYTGWAIYSAYPLLARITHNTFQSAYATGGVYIDYGGGPLDYRGNYHELVGAASTCLSLAPVNEFVGITQRPGGVAIESNIFNQSGSAGAVAVDINKVASGLRVGPNSFVGNETAIRLGSGAPQNIEIETQSFDGVTNTITDNRPYPNSARRFNQGLFLGVTGLNPLSIASANGALQRSVYKIPISKEVWNAAALYEDINIGDLPAKTNLVGIVCDTTVAYAGLAGTIKLRVGYSVGGQELMLDYDAKTLAVTKGLADADLGASLARAGAVQGGVMFWGAGHLYARLTSGTGNVGTGTVTNLSAGSTTVYIITEQMP